MAIQIENLKRPITMVQYAPRKRRKTVDSRLRRVEARSRWNRPEMKMRNVNHTASVAATTGIENTDITNIARGDGISERNGNAIRVWRVVVTGESYSSLDNHIIQAVADATPAETNFTTTIGAQLYPSTRSSLSSWKHFVPKTTTHRVYASVKFPRGMIVKYSSSTGTSVTKNRIWLTTINRDATARNVDCTVYVFYTDA